MRILKTTMRSDFCDGYYWRVFVDYKNNNNELKSSLLYVEDGLYRARVDEPVDDDTDYILEAYALDLAQQAFYEGASKFEGKSLSVDIMNASFDEALTTV